MALNRGDLQKAQGLRVRIVLCIAHTEIGYGATRCVETASSEEVPTEEAMVRRDLSRAGT
eukprot:3812678-Rhodomonas_salina.3